jgi:hypothetical protein
LKQQLALVATAILLYPVMFMVTRGHVYSFIAALSLTGSFLLAIRPKPNFFLVSVLISIAIGIRPINLVFVPLLCVIRKRVTPTASLPGMLITTSFIAAVSALASLAIAEIVYPEYNLRVFLDAYRYYEVTYEYAADGAAYGSSLLQAVIQILKGRETTLAATANIQMFAVARSIALALGLLVCLYSYRLGASRRSSVPHAILVCMAGMIIAAPIYVNYHLIALVVPILCAAVLEGEQQSILDRSVPSWPGQQLSVVDGITLILLLVPKPFPIATDTNVSAQTFINPAILFVFLACVILFNARDSGFRRRLPIGS